MNKLLLLVVVCPLLGSAVFASVAGLGFTVASLLRISTQRRSRAFDAAPSNG